ncbi:HD domain protein [Candidatus Phytoplasma oryzae]|uniref:CMP-binding protein n=1 Tax=Candidatus Phytoplasma oryzae TaxID=203274 RepID=A0A139JQ60_9MOLU|nr:HD domain-containing protein [Candidatus Phytoplasma oryzae]KXT29111.1 HD domain protein [Candidatus Phytoplasma oryzae]RAM57817.1 CMP-binding protein [Candidatus Phytoplasma oryzae]
MCKIKKNFLEKKKIGKKYSLIGKIFHINKGDNFYNIDLLLPEQFTINIKIEDFSEVILKERIYFFEVICSIEKEKKFFISKKNILIEDILSLEKVFKFYSYFFTCSPISFALIGKKIEIFLSFIKNKILFKLTANLYNKNKIKFLISPAAFKMHHAYYGGLSYHTLSMLEIAQFFLKKYSYLNPDLLYAGIILHDMAKVQEFNFEQKIYNKEGILLGHLILGVNNIHEEALNLGYHNKEEILLLKHLLISHHGLLEYGSAKKPQIAEALLLWFLDDIDSKINSLGEMLDVTQKGCFTEPLNVLLKKCFYKPNLFK